MSRARVVVGFTIALLVCGNAFFFLMAKKYKDSLIRQGVNTAHIEMLLKSYAVDLSYKEVKDRYEKIMPYSSMIKEVNADVISNNPMNIAMDPEVLIVGDTELYFKGGVFFGSKVEIPSAWLEL